MRQDTLGTATLAPWAALAGGLVALSAFFAVGSAYVDGWVIDAGSLDLPTRRAALFMLFWSLLGGLAAACLAVAVVGFARRRGEPWLRALQAGSDRVWLAVGMALALLVPLAIRRFVLDGAPLADDESAYRFMAQLLASGRLRAVSPPMKLFFDNQFMINDGHLYAQYFLGWPALLAPGIWLGMPGAMNAVYSALTLPALFLTLRRMAGSLWARLGLLVFLSAPMLQIAAATELAHTTCLLALAWLTWCALRSRDEAAPLWSHAAVALCFAAAFFNRPTAALGAGLPVLVWWALGLRRMARPARWRALLAFALPALVTAALFFAVNWIQNGSLLKVSYQRALEYAREVGPRFTTRGSNAGVAVTDMVFRGPAGPLANMSIALLRLNTDFLGWAGSLLLAAFAGRGRWARLAWWSLGGFFAAHLFLHSPGIDSFAPVHYFETAWPLLLLTVLGVERLTFWLRSCEEQVPGARRGVSLYPAALVAAFMFCALLGYTPVRLALLSRLAGNINMPRDAARGAGLDHAVVFVPRPYAPPCRSWPARHFLFFRPNNDPDLRNPVLWVNHLSVAEDRQLMAVLADRKGYLQVWSKDCKVRFAPLDEIPEGWEPYPVPPPPS